MNYDLSPRLAAIATDSHFVGTHHSLVESPHLERSLQVALAEYVDQCTRRDNEDSAAAAANMWKITGAREFIRLFKNLAESAELPKARDVVNLGLNRKM